MQVENRLLDIIRCAAVVVDDGNTGDGLEQLLGLDLIGAVGVDDDEQTARVGLDKRVLSGNENVLIVRILPQLVNEAPGHVVLEVDDDVRGLPALAAQAPDARRRAERVKVSHAVAHDEDLAGLRDELGQRSGHDAGFHARVPLGLLRASAVEREVIAVLDDGLIAAPGQGHVDGQIGKLEQLVSKNDAKKLQRQVVVADRNKTSNEKIYYSVDVIHTAIEENRQIRFHYFDWNVRKEMQLRKNGRFYQVSPWLLTWDDENYYLVAYDADAGKMKHYRVDKMLDLSAVDQARCGQTDYEQMDIASYSRKNFGMFAGEETTVQLLCDTSMTGVIIDRFGASVAMRPYDETHILAPAQVAVSPQFFGWLAGLSTHIRVISPDSVVNEYQIFLQEILRSYTDMQ